jgi:hypothetical protein
MAKYDISHVLSGPNLITSTIQLQIGLDSAASSIPALLNPLSLLRLPYSLPIHKQDDAGSNFVLYGKRDSHYSPSHLS